MRGNEKLKLWRCEKCTHKWKATISTTQKCPKCKSSEIAYFK